ncbi:MAG: carboxypeptidase regulatory-like domain-containing protein [bacterium]
MRVTLLLLTALVLPPAIARAQTTALAVVVTSDSSGTRVGGATVTLTEIGRVAETNWLGEARIREIPAGTYTLVVRKVGFAPLVREMKFNAGVPVEQEFLLTLPSEPASMTQGTAPQKLPEVHTTAEVHRSPKMAQFEERRKTAFGTFIDAEEIAKSANGKSLATLLQARTSGINIRQGSRAGALYLGASRGVATIGTLPRADPFDPQSPRGCWAAVYLDGHRIFAPSTGAGQSPAPNLNEFDLTTLQGIEFYKGGATTPAEIGGTGSACGTLVLWTRDK